MNPQLEQMEKLADDAKRRADAERAMEMYLSRVAQAKKIKARRRRLGRNGFTVGTMAVPKRRARHATRNSR